MGPYWNPLRPLVPHRFVVLAALLATVLASCRSHGEGTTGTVALRLTATSLGVSISWSASVDGGTDNPADVIRLSETTPFSKDFDIPVKRFDCTFGPGLCVAQIIASITISGRTSDRLTICLKDVGGRPTGGPSCKSSTGPFVVVLITAVD
jgi:hypothetical protein